MKPRRIIFVYSNMILMVIAGTVCSVQGRKVYTGGAVKNLEAEEFKYNNRYFLDHSDYEEVKSRLSYDFCGLGDNSEDVKKARDLVGSKNEFKEAISKASPGDTIYIRDGVYENWERLDINVNGSENKPITIAPQNQHGVRFTGKMLIHVQGEYVCLQGLDFVDVNNGPSYNAFIIFDGDYGRITGCRFVHCGGADREPQTCWYLAIFRTRHGRFDHNSVYRREAKLRFAGSREMYEKDIPGLSLCDHNIFRDSRGLRKKNVNVEAIFTGRGFTHVAYVMTRLVAEYNLFDYENGDKDGEIVTDKSSGNVWRHNVFANGNCRFSDRHGNTSTIYGNVFAQCIAEKRFQNHPMRCHQLNGRYHVFVNNYILHNQSDGLGLAWGDVHEVVPGKKAIVNAYGAESVRDSVIAHNTFIGNHFVGLTYPHYLYSKRTKNGERLFPYPAKNNLVANNIFEQSQGTMLDFKGTDYNTIRNNVFHNVGDASPGQTGKSPLITDPVLSSAVLPRLGDQSPVKGKGERLTHPHLPAGFYGASDVDPGVLDEGVFGFDYAGIPHIPEDLNVLEKEPLEAVVKKLTEDERVRRPIVFDAGISRGKVAEFRWDFGDGTRVVEPKAMGGVIAHCYSSPGPYDITLSVRGQDGRTDSTSIRVLVREE